MAVRMADTAEPMGDFPIAKAKHIEFEDGEKLQEKLDNGTLGSGGGGEPYNDAEVRGLINTNKTNIATNTSDISDLNTKIGTTAMGTTATDVTGAVAEVNGNLLDTVSFSADYKNIVLNRKNGTNPYTIPISAIINHAKLIELSDIDTADIGNGKTLIYDTTTQKHKYVSSSGTDELVKMDAATDAHYLVDLIDKQTVVNENGVLKVKMLDGQDVTITEINYLKGLTMNVMDLVNAFANGGVKVHNTPVATHADLATLDRSKFIDGISYIVYVLADESHAGAKTTYLCTKTSSTYFGNADSQRNFTTNPINLANEVTGKLGTSNIDVDSLWALLTIDDTYKTLTTTNNSFGTHGAKALYDELTTAIGAKANVTDLTTHTDDTNIHVTTDERTKWDKVIDKVDTTDFNTHKNDTDIHVTTSDKIKWDKVIDKVDTTDFDSLKNKVDEKVDKTSIITANNPTATDDQVYSAKVINSELDNINANLDEKINKKYSTYGHTWANGVDKAGIIIDGGDSESFTPLLQASHSNTNKHVLGIVQDSFRVAEYDNNNNFISQKELATMDKLGGCSIIKGTTTLITNQSGAMNLAHGGNFDHCTVSIQPTNNNKLYFFSYCPLSKNNTYIIVTNWQGELVTDTEIEFDWVIIGW